GVFVGQHGALRLEHRAAYDVLRGDQLDLVALAAELERNRIGNLRIAVGQRGGKQALVRRFCMGYRHADGLTNLPHENGPLSAGDTPRAGIIPAAERKAWDISADNAATFRDQAPDLKPAPAQAKP